MAIGRRVLRLDDVTSTNDVAKSLGKEGEAEGTIVLAKRQTGGRGRLGRRWSSPMGGLYLSVLLRPGLGSDDVLRLTVLACVPVAEAIEEVTGLEVRLKWPNDIIVGGKKAGGILVEGVSKGRELDFIVLGLGLNVNTPLEHIEAGDATSLSAESDEVIDEERLFESVVAHLVTFYKELLSGDFDEEKYVRRSSVLGHGIEAMVGKETIRGKALYLEPNGALVIRSEEGLVLRLSWVNETSIRITNNEEMHANTLRKD